MAALVAVLEADGIEVVDCYDSREKADTVYSSVVFRGGDGAGLRAVELAWAHDYEPQGLVRDWAIWGRDICEPDWTMLFD